MTRKFNDDAIHRGAWSGVLQVEPQSPGDSVERSSLTTAYAEAASRWAPDDLIVGTPGDDTLTGTQWIDTMQGGDGADSMSGGLGDDLLYGGSGNDTLIGGDGTDRLYGDDGDDLLIGAGVSTFGDDLHGGAGDDTLIGGDHREWMDGGAGNDSMVGGADGDSFKVVSGESDTVEGGAGKDHIEADWSGATEDIVWINDPATPQRVQGALISSIEWINATFGSGNDTLVSKGSKYDHVYGGLGNDHLEAGGQLWGEEGNDTLLGNGLDNLLIGGSGNDSVDGGKGNDALGGWEGRDWVYGGAGDDTVSGDSFNHPDNKADTLDGGEGVDQLVADWRDDSGAVQLTTDKTTHVLYGDTFTRFEAFDLTLGKGDDTVTASAKDTINGGDGNDSLLGGGHLDGGDGDDTVIGGSGNDLLHGGDGGDDEVYGMGGSDALYAYGGMLDAGDGNDTLESSFGEATMIGGTGADQFLAGMQTENLVLDFEQGIDRVGIDRSLVGNGNKNLDGALTVTGPGGFSSDAELVIVTADISGELTAAAAAAAIGSATDGYRSFDSAVFVVDNGTDSAVFLFTSASSAFLDAVVSADELELVTTLTGVAETTIADYMLY